jgi:hypothetical protein
MCFQGRAYHEKKVCVCQIVVVDGCSWTILKSQNHRRNARGTISLLNGVDDVCLSFHLLFIYLFYGMEPVA